MYNFDDIAERRNTYSYKWDVEDDELPMWVADMDFKVASPIVKAIENRISIQAFGYSNVPDEYFTAYKNFYKDLHALDLKEEWMIFSTGVVPSISSIVRMLTKANDNVVVISPCYNVFYNSIINNGRNVSSCDLLYNDGSFKLDFECLEENLKKDNTSLLIFCNPHNPSGNIWTNEELKRVIDLCNKYDVYLISDEIHGDIISPGVKYNPIFGVDADLSRVIMLASASKCYNLAGLQASIAVVKDKKLRFKVWRGINNDECGENNFFCADAHIAALNDSRDWLKEMNEYVYNNKKYLYSFIEKNMPLLKVIKSDALYLVWIDISKISDCSDNFCLNLRKNTGLYISSGRAYGSNGNGFVRINLATSLENVRDGCNRLLNEYNRILNI